MLAVGCWHSQYWLSWPQLGVAMLDILSPTIHAKGFQRLSKASSNGTLSSIRMVFFASPDHKTTSGLKVVWMTWGNCSFCSRLFIVVLAVVDGFSPSLTSLLDDVSHVFGISCISPAPGCYEQLVMMPSVSSLGECYFTPWKDVCHSVLHKVCIKPLIPNFSKCVGVGSVSYTDCSRKEMQKGSNFHRSAHVIFLLGRSHLVKAPCIALYSTMGVRCGSLLKVKQLLRDLRCYEVLRAWSSPAYDQVFTALHCTFDPSCHFLFSWPGVF